MNKLISVMRVNYTLSDIFRAFFIFDKNTRYRERLVDHICNYFKVSDAVLTSSCRNAIFLLLKSMELRKVIVPAYTCGVVVEAAMLAEKEIVYAHVDSNTLNADFSDVEISNDCIVIVTHQYGNPCSIKTIVERCKRAGAVVIEDCAGSLGTKVDGQLTGTFGDYGVFSFSASKTLQSPTKGGFIITKNESALTALKAVNDNYPYNWKVKIKTLLKGIGFCLNNSPFWCKIISKIRRGIDGNGDYTKDSSYNNSFHEWQAYVVLKQFKKMEGILSRRREMARMYRESIKNRIVNTFDFDENAIQIRYPLLIQDKGIVIKRAYEQGIQLSGGYDKVYFPDTQEFSVEQSIVRDIVYLPFGSRFSEKEQKKVIDFINNLNR